VEKEMKQVLKTGAELRSFLERIVETSVQSAQDVVAEEERQRQIELYKKMQEQEEEVEEKEEEEEVEEEPAAEKPKAAAKPEEDAEKDPMQRPSAADRAPEKPKTPDEVDLKNILYSINQIRSGRSLKDREVRDNLDDYFNRLSPVERLALSEFLEGLSDVIVDGVPAADAESPDEEIVMQASDKTAKAVASKEKKAEPQQKAKPSSSPEEIAPPIKVAQ
jgi:hypothetical protein